MTPAGEVREEAKRRTGEVVFRVTRGWAFGLSYGAVDPDVVAGRIESSGLRVETKELGDVTEEVVGRLRGAVGASAGEVSKEWLLSARLHPNGRASTIADWQFLGTMVAALGAPSAESQITPFETTGPNDTHYWAWSES